MERYLPVKCSVIIRAYNEEKHIGQLLEGIKQQSLKDYEVILVDSGSTDNTTLIAEEYGVKIVNIKKEDFTFGRSLNTGVEESKGEFVINISAHCYPVYPDWLEQLIKPFEDEKIAVSYGKQRGGQANHYSEHQWFKYYFPDVPQPRQANPYTHNANAAIRRSLWIEHKYSETLTGLEDLEWSSWALEQGYFAAYVPEAEVIHKHSETLKQVHNRYLREAIAMKQILPESTFSFWNFFRLWTSKAISDLRSARREGVFWQELWDVIGFRLVQYWGTYRGYNYSGAVDSDLHQSFYYPPDFLSRKQAPSRDVKPIDYYEGEELE